MSSTSSFDSDSYYSDDSCSYIYYSHTERSTGSDEDSDADAEICYPYPVPLNTKVKETIPTAVADLKEIAALSVALAFWRHVNIPQVIKKIYKDNVKNSNIESTIYNEVLKSTKDIFTPKSITNLIFAYIDKIRNEIKDWVSYIFRKVFFDYRINHFVYNHICHIVFYSNGTINHKETARNLFMNSLRLSETEKYYLLCTYCLKNDLERLSPLLPSSNDVNICTFDDHPLIYYWNCFFRNEMDKIAVPGTESIDTFMIKHRDVDNWPAKEYFLDHLDFNEQVRMAIWLIDKHDMKYLQLLLRKLDDHQRSHVIALRAMQIIFMLICTRSHFEETLSMWLEIRELINENQFLMIFNLSLNAGSYDVLEAIWTTACTELRDFVLKACDECTIAGMLRRWTSDPENDTFFCIMQHANEDFKTNITEKSFFIEACKELIGGDKLKHLDRLLKSCFPDTEKLAKFKQEFVAKESFGKYCEKLMNNNKHEILQDLLNSFFTNAEELAKFKRSLKVMNLITNKIKSLHV